jgi:hypothetical protein
VLRAGRTAIARACGANSPRFTLAPKLQRFRHHLRGAAMRIGIVGGAEKALSRVRYEELARSRGCAVEFHDGHTDGRGSETLRSLVGRCDVVVIVTRVNSHNAVRLARQLIRQHGRAALFVPRFGLNQFESVVGRQPLSAPQIQAIH